MLFKTLYKRKLTGCSAIRRYFSEYLDGVLNEEERFIVHEHVKYCKSCSQDLDLMCRALTAMVEFHEESMPAGFQSFRVPRSTFVEIFPTIRRDKPELSIAFWTPYVSVVAVFFVLLASWITWENHLLRQQQYNVSNYIEVIAKS